MSGDIFEADVMAETLRRTNLGDLVPGSILNLERALSLRSRLGGHIVSGHIDGTGTILSFEKEDNATWITIGTEPKILKYIIEKGSIAIDGVSLTVAKVSDSDFAVSIIPHTSEETILLKKKSGDTVNLENDIIGKYVEKLLSYQQKDERRQDESQIDLGFLAENGFL
jgi:riboflavin synthase